VGDGGVDGVAATPTGVWVLRDGALAIDEYDQLGGTRIDTIAVELVLGEHASGLAWDGEALWVGVTGGESAYALRIDAMHHVSRKVTLPAAVADLAVDGGNLVTVSGGGGYQWIDPDDGKLMASIPVRRLASVAAVATHGTETWVAQPGSPALVYDDAGTLLATVDVAAIASASTPLHMTFVGDQLVVVNGATATTYTIAR